MARATVPRAETQGKRPLRPRARILRTLGDELISSETVAVLELVKNSYDADATRVLVRFTPPLSSGKGTVEILDNGHGMSLATIQDTWLEPATFHRVRSPTSERRGRRVLGQKGIGRFAASRLAERLEVITRRASEASEAHAQFDWSQFDDEDRYLDEVEIGFWKESPEVFTAGGLASQVWEESDPPIDASWKRRPHGTLLRMGGLRSDWEEEMLQELRTGLSRLISPFHADTLADEFQIRLEVPDPFERFSGLIEPPELLRDPPYSLVCDVDARGHYTLRIKAKGAKKETLARGQYKRDAREPECGRLHIELRVWDRDAASLGEVAHQYGSSLRDVRGDLNRSAGINIYRDGFRVLPYGEPRNDWLRLDLRRVQNPTLRLSNNQIVGYVLISADANPNLRDQSNREGLIENQAFEDLSHLLEEILAKLEQGRWDVRHPKGRGQRPRGGLFEGFDLKPVRSAVQRRHPSDTDLLNLITETEQDLERRVEEVEHVLSRYRRLATLGQLIDTVLHDARAPIAKINNEAELGLRDIRREDDGALVQSLERRLSLIDQQADVAATVFRKIEPFGGRRRGRPKRLVLEQIIADGFDVLATEIAEVGVDVKLPATTNEVTVDPAELEEVIINLLQNSLYWLRQVPPPGDRQVAVRVRRRTDGLEILFSDSGPGVDPDFADRIFEPYFSTKPDGVGLGLAIAGEIVSEYYNGELELLGSGPLSGATFRIILRRRV